jgi:hypothetical protein
VKPNFCFDFRIFCNGTVRVVGEKRWEAIDDCSFIYPLVQRVAKGELTVPLQKIWLFYKTSKKHHKFDIYTP